MPGKRSSTKKKQPDASTSATGKSKNDFLKSLAEDQEPAAAAVILTGTGTDGSLILGSSETIGGFTNLFETLDKKWKIFRRREVPMALREQIVFPSGPPTMENGMPTVPMPASNGGKADIAQLTQRAILERSKSTNEELQSLNEELQTVNPELQSKVEELSASHDDMRNLLNSTEIATIFVDNDKRIRRFTPTATAIINLIPVDIGRPLQHVVSNLADEVMLDDLTEVLTTLTPKLREVRTTTGQWYKMRIIPYRTRSKRIGGAVLTFASIDVQKQAQQDLMDASVETAQAWQLVRSVFDMNTDPLAVLDSDGRIVIANAAFTALMGIAPEKVRGLELHDIQNGMTDKSELSEKLKRAVERGEDFQTDAVLPALTADKGAFQLKGRIHRGEETQPYRILLQFAREC
jgi:PAS domain-containing protein